MSWNKFTSAIRQGIFAVILSLCLFFGYGCSIPDLSKQSLPDFDLPILGDLGNDLKEVSPPELIQSLKAKLVNSDPRVSILEPSSGELFDDNSVAVKLAISGLKLFEDEALGLGPHIALFLDDRDPIEVFDDQKPIVFDDLRPGTHTLRAIAEYPWHESFKSANAYAQVSFDVLTSSHANAAGSLPILSVSSIDQTYTDEPMLLDFVVRNAQSSISATGSPRVKVSLNNESFVIDSADGNVYLSGLETGQNWIKLELQDAKGHLSQAPFSEQLFGFEFRPEKTSATGNIFAQKVSLDAVGSVVGIAKPKPPEIVKPTAPSPAAPQLSNNIQPSPAASSSLKTTVSKPPTAAPDFEKKDSTTQTSDLKTATSTPKPGAAVVERKTSLGRKVTAERNSSNSLQLPKISSPETSRPPATSSLQKPYSQSAEKAAATKPELTSKKDESADRKSLSDLKTQPSAQTPSDQKPTQDFSTQMRSLKDNSKKQVNQTFNSWREQFDQRKSKSAHENVFEASTRSIRTTDQKITAQNSKLTELSKPDDSDVNSVDKLVKSN